MPASAPYFTAKLCLAPPFPCLPAEGDSCFVRAEGWELLPACCCYRSLLLLLLLLSLLHLTAPA